eukprot:TRINITY_DN21666_c0_g1_i1.p1 TRINITY_DN21666_c0_g1~~TRINITY_DN21666_c0_g1_i1.p1  ORF type:complete len:501 (-),score=60.54 TRINITY_DN21666_c0_g1_i1:1165-2667(-)
MRAVVALVLLIIYASVADAGLKDLTTGQHKVGAMWETEQVNNWNIQNIFSQEFEVATLMTYAWTTQPGSTPAFQFGEVDAMKNKQESMGLLIHGHPLIWYLSAVSWPPAWLQNLSPTYGAVQNELWHRIDGLLGRYGSVVDAWDVVNEAVKDGDSLPSSGLSNWRNHIRTNHVWYQGMQEDYILESFSHTKWYLEQNYGTNNGIQLLYNDYAIETTSTAQTRKWTVVKALVAELKNYGCHGLGWQMHVHVSEVLQNDFPLADRMQEISDLGLDNYITELDIRISNSGQFNDQKLAYKKIAWIFKNNPTAKWFQTWGTTDEYSWWKEFDGGANWPSWPLPWDSSFNKKPAYYGIAEGLGTQPYPIGSAVRITNRWANMPAGTSNANTPSQVSIYPLNNSWTSQQWVLESTGTAFRIRNVWTGRYLHQNGDLTVSDQTLNTGWTSQLWDIEEVNGNIVRLRCHWVISGNKYLSTPSSSANTGLITDNLNTAWWSQQWIITAV